MTARFRPFLASLLLCATLALAQEPQGQQPPQPPAMAAEPDPENLPYTVEIEPTGDDPLDAALKAITQLVTLQESSPTTAG